MGGAGNLGSKLISGDANIGDALRIGAGVSTLGFSEVGYAADRTNSGLGTPAQTIADSMGVLQSNQASAAADASKKLLETPKNITPDNFLSMKAKQLAQLRLGMGGGMAPGGSSPLLSSTALSGADPSKKKLLGQ